MEPAGSQRLKDVSLRHILGFTGQRFWLFLMFYSIVPYISATDIRGTLYQNQIVSLFAFVVGAALMMVIYKPGTHIAQSKIFAWAGGTFMAAGTVLCLFSDAATAQGMLITTIGGIVTGVGSSVLFILWVRILCTKGPDVTVIEYCAATAIGLVASLILLFVPAVIAIALMIILPFTSAAIYGQVFEERAKIKPEFSFTPLSRPGKALIVKALVGIFVIGILQGYTDIISGYNAFSATDTHGTILFLTGILAALILVILGVLSPDPVDMLYRVSILLLGFGFVLMAFTQQQYTFYTAISLAGYMAFILFALLASRLVSSAFGTGATRSIALGIGVAYFGEAIGLVAGDATTNILGGNVSAELISIGCVLIFLLIHIFLFTEMDLVRLGIGEENAVLPTKAIRKAQEALDSVPTKETPQPAESPDIFQKTADEITEKYHLSPREADVLLLLLQGRTMARIEEALYISAGTVSTHMRHIYQKTGVANRQQLLDLAFPKE